MKLEFPPSLINIFENNHQPFFSNLRVYTPYYDEEQEESWSSHTKTYCGHSFCNENVIILLTYDLHRLANDANDFTLQINLLFRQLIQTDISIISTVS